MNRLILFASLLSLAADPVQASEPIGQSKFVPTSDGVKIHCLENGNGPAILFVAGWTMPAEIWEYQIRRFAKTHRVVAMDPRSQGRSSDSSEGHHPAARARDIKAVVDQLNLAPVVLVGWSLGAVEIAAYIDQFGTETVRGLVFVDGRVGDDVDPQRTDGLLRFIDAYQRDRQGVTTNFVRNLFKTPRSEEYVKRITAASLRTPANTALALLMGYITADLRPALSKIDKPALVFVAGRAADHEVKLAMKQQIPGAQLEVFDNAGHALFVDEPDRFNAVLEQFLKKE
ncbi:MAG: alpha/beta hydrolase [Chloroflexi bacterium]|nr:alpha/beta hydrolase [Chloroflexota bacterium]